MAAIHDRVVTAVEERRRTILEVIAGARREIVLSLFRCKDRQIFAALAEAAARGVAVDALVTARAKGGRQRVVKLCDALKAAGAAVSLCRDPVVKNHGKYLIADDGPAVVASLNFTKKCFTSTLDALVVTYDADVVSGLRRLMAADRDGQPFPDRLTPRLIIGPERARAQLTELIESATSRIRIVDAKLSDSDLTARLNAKRDAGVAIDVFSAKRIGDLKSHGKVLLVDDRIAVVGSLALAALSLDFRREVAIAVDDPDAVAEVGRFFDTIASTVSNDTAGPIETIGQPRC